MKFIDLNRQYQSYKSEIDAAIQRVLDHSQFIMGPEVFELEEKLADYTNARYCITCANGTDALLLALMAIDIQPGDEIITPAFGYIAAAEMITLLKAKPVFVDVEEDTALLDASLIEDAITDRTRAIIPISLYGQCADMDKINAIAERNNLVVIEDAAQSFGARYKGRKSCNLSTIACTSFFPTKPLGCYGDGGACFTSDRAIAENLARIRLHGRSQRHEHTALGINSRLDSIQAAVLLVKLSHYEEELTERNTLACLLTQELGEGLANLPIRTRDENQNAYALYTLRAKNRKSLENVFAENGIPVAIHYPTPLHKQPPMAPYKPPQATPASEKLANSVVSVPLHPFMDAEEISRIAKTIQSAVPS